MSSIRDLAREFGAQPHEVAAFADLGAGYDEVADLAPDVEALIRDAWTTEH